jgi:hypothetical protein
VETLLVTTLGVLLPVCAALTAVLGVGRRWPWQWLWMPLHHPAAPGSANEDEDDDGPPGVREPRRPLPSSSGAAAYAEPDERAA